MMRGVILRTECKGRVYRWVEKNGSACLTADETELLWWGVVREMPFLEKVPAEVLLEFSVRRLLT